MPSRSVSTFAVAVLLVVAGCLGGSTVPTFPSETQSVTTSPSEAQSVTTPTTTVETATATPATPAATTTARPCSLDGSNATLPAVEAPAKLSAETAGRVAETVESRYQSARVEEHSYFNHHTNVDQLKEIEGGYRVVLGGELDYDHRGNENGTVVHAHRPYTATYLVTDRKVVRRGEAGVTGTVVCWSPNQ